MAESGPRLFDIQFAKFLARRCELSGESLGLFRDIVCRLSISLANGDSCLVVTEAEKAVLLGSPLTGGGAPNENTPLCLVGNRLYLQRILDYERLLAAKVGRLLADSEVFTVNKELLRELFGDSATEGEVDWQRRAALQALRHSFLIISGGPGTGKTTTVVKILALLQDAAGAKLRVALAAPTGKAAMRLQESITASLGPLALSPEIAASIPVVASTLHRLLGVQRNSPVFQHNQENPLHYNVVVVDEASMVDLALMAKLLAALPPGGRLILLGDKDQLASVESGTVLADMTLALPNNSVQLQRSYRFDTGIKDFAAAINQGDASSAWGMMCSQSPENVSRLTEEAAVYAGGRYCDYMEAALGAASLADYGKLFEIFQSFKVLCGLRRGPSGVEGLNRQIEYYLRGRGYHCPEDDWYVGRPIMVNRNDYGLGLFNGDMGLCLPDPADPGSLKVWFEGESGKLKGLLPGRIASCETVYALTVHKSQGAEIGEVLVVLPEQVSRLMSRELLYTAVTRARSQVLLKADRAVFEAAVTAKVERHSGLVDALQGRMLAREV